LNYRSVGNNRCFCNSKTAANVRKTLLWRIYLRDSEDFLRSLYAADSVSAVIDGDLSSNGRIVQFYQYLLC